MNQDRQLKSLFEKVRQEDARHLPTMDQVRHRPREQRWQLHPLAAAFASICAVVLALWLIIPGEPQHHEAMALVYNGPSDFLLDDSELDSFGTAPYSGRDDDWHMPDLTTDSAESREEVK